MSAYLIVDLEVTDETVYEEYRRQVPASLAQHGAKLLVRGGRVATLEGGWRPHRIVVVEFPSMDAAQRWYDSEEYRGPKALRLKSTRGSAVLVEGVSAQP